MFRCVSVRLSLAGIMVEFSQLFPSKIHVLIEWLFSTEPDTRLIITVVSESGTILIYNSSQLIWAAQLSFVPTAICRTNVTGLPGAIGTLCENGKVDISYLGSDPQLFQVPPLNMQKLNFEKTQNELIQLEKEIKAGIDFTDVSSVNEAAERDLNITFTIDPTLLNCEYTTNIRNTTVPIEDVKMVRASVKLYAKTLLEHIQVHFHCSAPLLAKKAIHSFEQLSINQQETIEAYFYVDNTCNVSSAMVTVITSFVNKQSIPRVIEKRQFLPLSMFYKLHAPQKESLIKLTLTTNLESTPSIERIFSEHFDIDSAPNALGFRSTYTGKLVTIVAAKNSNRYRIQSDHLPAMACILEALLRGIKDNADAKVRISTTSPLPINALISHVDAHYKSYEKVGIIRVRIGDANHFTMLTVSFFYV